MPSEIGVRMQTHVVCTPDANISLRLHIKKMMVDERPCILRVVRYVQVVHHEF